MIPNLFPAELRSRAQWMAAGAGDPSSKEYKRPISPKSGHWGDPTDPRHWGTFEEAMAMGYPLVGYCFHKDDPYCVIDLDTYKAEDDQVRAMHREVIRHSEHTYRELSQSGLGTHIIGRGQVAEGAHNEANAIEIYSHARFMICTGKHEPGVAIEAVDDIQALLDYLYPLLKSAGAGAINWRELDAGEEGDLSDAELLEKACNAVNAEYFVELCHGDMSRYGNDHSRADMAFLQHLCFYTKDNQQVARIFFASPLGRRDKAARMDYVPRSIARCRKMIQDDQPPPVDASAILARANALSTGRDTPPQDAPTASESAQGAQGQGEGQATPVARSQGEETPFPPGLVGDVAKYVLASSIRPAHDIALVTAIGVVAGICGRNFNISDTGLNQYMLLLAKTGTGKESVQSSVDRLFNEVQKRNPAAGDRFIGPAKFSSGPALIKRFQDQPVFLSIMGEFGATMRNMHHPRANAAEVTLKQALLDLFGKSGWGQMLRPSVYSDKEKNTQQVHAPALSIVAETAPEPFYSSLDESAIESGFLPRFVVVEHLGDRPKRNRNAWALPPEQLVMDVNALATTVLQMEQNGACTAVQCDEQGQRMLDEFDEYADDQMRGNGETIRHLWNRAHLKALRLSALVAVGVNPYKPVVTAVEAQWAIDLVRRDVRTLQQKFASGDIGEGDGKIHADLRKVIAKFVGNTPKAWVDIIGDKKGCIPLRALQQATACRACFKNDRRGSTRALKDTLQAMVEGGELSIVAKDQAKEWFKSTSTFYALGDHWDKGD
jgi:hypothetical protein